MSFVIAVHVREGIVMASDSRLTLNTTNQELDGKQVIQLATGMSDTSYKTFLAPNNIGISTYGVADIAGVPIAGYVEAFIREKLAEDTAADDVPPKLLEYFREFPTPPLTYFLVAGYQTEEGRREQRVWSVDVPANTVQRLDSDFPEGGARWGGEKDILTRLTNSIAVVDTAGTVVANVPSFGIPFQFFTLQDAIDFAVYAVRVTIDSIRFQTRAKTVGGPIDVLVIKPTEACWIDKKELHV